ncbi:hypothetical protein N9B54_04305 [Mariniblastus sp.]|nr:hypothetical protein [Mariniblastus sp.]MDB4380282.1 hypothetical protein [Mariniblastus sp.]
MACLICGLAGSGAQSAELDAYGGFAVVYQSDGWPNGFHDDRKINPPVLFPRSEHPRRIACRKMEGLIVKDIDSKEFVEFFYWLVLGYGFAMCMAAVMWGVFQVSLMF